MFQFKDGRLYPNLTPRKLSFKLPEGFWFQTDADCNSYYGIVLWSENMKVRVEITVGSSYYYDDTAQEAADFFEIEPKEVLDGPYPVTAGDLTGHGIYSGGEDAMYIAFLDVGQRSILGFLTDEQDSAGEDDWFRRVTVVIDVDCNGRPEDNLKALHKAVQDKGVVELMNSFRFEK